MTNIIVVESVGIIVIILGITYYSVRIYLRAKRPPKPYPGTEAA